jgi:hypothetical protein
MARNSQSLAPAPRPLQSDKGLSSIRLAEALGVPQVFRAAIGREMRRTRIGGVVIKSAIAPFG